MNNYNVLLRAILKMVKSVSSRNYSLVLDVADLKPATPESTEVFGKIMEVYKESSFRKKIALHTKSSVMKSQFKRVVGDEFINNFINNFILVDTLEEALSKAKE